MGLRHILIIAIIGFSCAQDKKEEHVKYHSNNEIALSGTTLNGLKIGKWVRYDSLGNKITEFEYDSGQLVKRYIYSNGFLFAEEEMSDEDFKDGLTVTYYEGGRIRSKNNFKNNKQLGKQIYYFQNGSIDSKYMETDSGIINFSQYYEKYSCFRINHVVRADPCADGIRVGSGRRRNRDW